MILHKAMMMYSVKFFMKKVQVLKFEWSITYSFDDGARDLIFVIIVATNSVSHFKLDFLEI